MEQIVRVRKIHENGMATVIHVRESACSGDCHKCSGCGAAKETVVFDAYNGIGAAPGDLVVVKSETAPVMKAVGVFYVLPMVLFFLGYWLGDVLWHLGALVGGLGFAGGIALAVAYDRVFAIKNPITYTITGFAGDFLLNSIKKGDNHID